MLQQQLDELGADEGIRMLVYDDATGRPIGPGTLVRGHPTIGIGTDSDLKGYDQMPKDQYDQLKASYKASYGFRDKIDTDGFNHPQKIYDLTASLVKRGYSDSNIQAILGGNFRRLLASTWKDPAQKKTGDKS